jgi:GntR family transcriptional regulator
VGLLESPPPLDRASPKPIFEQVKSLVQRAIAAGELTSNSRVPSERELSAQLGVSRMTIRQALLELISEGALYTRPGKGTFVSDQKIEQPLQRLTSFTQDMLARGRRPASRLLAQEIVPAPLDLAHVLDVVPGSELLRIARLRLADDQPMALEVTHLPHALCPGLLRFDLSSESLYDLLRRKYGVALVSAKQTIEASPASEEEQELLELPAHVPVLRIHRRTSAADGRIVEYVRAVYRGDRYQLQVDLR